MLQNFLEGVRRGAEIQNVTGDLVHFVDVVLRQRRDVLGGVGMSRHEKRGVHFFNALEGVEISGDVVNIADLVFIEGRLAG